MTTKITIPDGWHQVTAEQYVKLKGLNIQDNLIEITSILTGVSTDEVEKYSVDTFREILQAIGWIVEIPDESSYKQEITVNDKQYYLIKPSTLSLMDWIKIISLVKDPDKNLVKIYSMLYGGDMSKAMITDLYGALVFFCNTEKKYYEIMQIYLMNQMKMMNQQTNTKRFFPGWNLFTRWRRVGSAT